MTDLKKIFCCGFILISSSLLHAQHTKDPNISITGLTTHTVDSAKKIVINELLVTGTKKTKPYIVYREIQFKTGDSLSIAGLSTQLEQARQQVYNTSLFNEVNLEAVVTDLAAVNITVTVKERWYWYPVPQFQWVDRNFNEWYKTYNARFDRVNYGLKFVHYNLSGRKDQLRVYLINGYSRNISFSYTAPYSNKALTEGFTVGAGFTQKREVAYKTSYRDSLLFYPSDSATKAKAHFVYKNWYAHASYIIRRGLFKKHIFSVSYNYIKLADSVINKNNNPNYFGQPVSSKGYIDLSYVFQYSNLNNNSYPLKGISGFVGVIKRGLGFSGGINMLNFEAGLNKYYDLGKNWYSSIQFNGKIKLPFEQAYINQRGLGYGESYLRGLEYYVIDAVATGLAKTTLKKKILSFNVPFPFFPKLLTKIPFNFFAKTYADVGYAYNKKPGTTYLNNRLLYSGGFGIDILTLYDINLRFEYSFNQLNENGLFLHNQSGF
ncbi:MAG TPA: POTRA domain-containing protein [Ferruginibacter sp.]|nr:POTRA domain-containing protein [Ferruginibacter sp.]